MAIRSRARGGDRGRLDRRGGALRHQPFLLTRRGAGGRGEGSAAEVAGRRVAGVGVLRQRTLDHRVERRRHAVPARLRRRIVQVRPQLGLITIACVGDLAGEHKAEQAAERVHVHARVHPLAADLLRRDVVERPDPVAGLRRARSRERVLGEPEVGQVHVVLGTEQDVRGLDVAVHEPGVVRGVQRRADLRDHARRPLRRELSLAPHQAADVVAGDVAHRDVRDAVLLARVVDRDHVGVIDRRRDLGLAHEPRAHRLVIQQPGRDHLQRHGAVERELGSPVHHAHAAASGDVLYAVSGEDGAGCELAHSIRSSNQRGTRESNPNLRFWRPPS